MAVEMFDSHSYVKKLCSVGVPEKQAEVYVDLQMAMSKDQLASKADIHEVKAEIHEVKAELRTEIHECKAELKVDIHELIVRMEKLNHDLTMRMAGMLVGTIGVMGAMFKFFN